MRLPFHRGWIIQCLWGSHNLIGGTGALVVTGTTPRITSRAPRVSCHFKDMVTNPCCVKCPPPKKKNAGLKATLETTHLILTAQAHHILSHLPDADEWPREYTNLLSELRVRYFRPNHVASIQGHWPSTGQKENPWQSHGSMCYFCGLSLLPSYQGNWGVIKAVGPNGKAATRILQPTTIYNRPLSVAVAGLDFWCEVDQLSKIEGNWLPLQMPSIPDSRRWSSTEKPWKSSWQKHDSAYTLYSSHKAFRIISTLDKCAVRTIASKRPNSEDPGIPCLRHWQDSRFQPNLSRFQPFKSMSTFGAHVNQFSVNKASLVWKFKL